MTVIFALPTGLWMLVDPDEDLQKRIREIQKADPLVIERILPHFGFIKLKSNGVFEYQHVLILSAL